MTKMTQRTLLRIHTAFTRLDAPTRTWLLARLTADHEEMLQEENLAA